MTRARNIDRALMPQSRVIWIVTVAILLVGLLVLLWVFSPGERQRRTAVDALELGDDADRVLALLGPPAECPPASLDHLRPTLPDGMPPATAEQVLERLARETKERWVYPLDERDPADCGGGEGQTEIGVDAGGRLLWYLALTGKSRLRFPPGYAENPAGT